MTSVPGFGRRFFAINFAMGRGHRDSMEFQFRNQLGDLLRTAGGVIGQTLAMEGMFSFFLESTSLRYFPVWGEPAGAEAPFADSGLRDMGGIVAFRLLHHRDGRLDAASGGFTTWGRTARSF